MSRIQAIVENCPEFSNKFMDLGNIPGGTEDRNSDLCYIFLDMCLYEHNELVVQGLHLLGQFFSRGDNPLRELMTTQIIPDQELADAYTDMVEDIQALKRQIKWIQSPREEGSEARRIALKAMERISKRMLNAQGDGNDLTMTRFYQEMVYKLDGASTLQPSLVTCRNDTLSRVCRLQVHLCIFKNCTDHQSTDPGSPSRQDRNRARIPRARRVYETRRSCGQSRGHVSQK